MRQVKDFVVYRLGRDGGFLFFSEPRESMEEKGFPERYTNWNEYWVNDPQVSEFYDFDTHEEAYTMMKLLGGVRQDDPE